jgi:hypothetical protein
MGVCRWTGRWRAARPRPALRGQRHHDLLDARHRPHGLFGRLSQRLHFACLLGGHCDGEDHLAIRHDDVRHHAEADDVV